MTTSGSHALPTNGRHAVANIFRILGAAAALLGLVYFGVKIGASEHRIETIEARLGEEIGNAAETHMLIEARTDAKLAQQRELLLVELREINRRLERIEQRLRP